MTNVNYSQVSVRRMKDASSPAHINLSDRVRSWLKLRNPRISAGTGIVIKRGVNISICETGHLDIGDNCLFHAFTQILLTMPNPKVRIGKWVFVGMHSIIASKNSLVIGDYTVIAPYCYFIDHEHGFSANDIILNQRSELKETVIGRDCYFGTGTTVLAGVSIGDGSILGAGSVVTKDVPPGQIWAGNPARYVKDRV